LKQKAPRKFSTQPRWPSRIVAIGVSTGGPQALQYLFSQIPADFSGCIVVVQHMPEGFTEMFARRLDEACALEVKEAQSGDLLLAGRVLICPGDRHLKVRRMDHGDIAILVDQARVNGHRPSVDVLFHSVAQEFSRKTIGILMTGMGEDGAAGLGAIREAGGYTIAQHPESCVVDSMPRAAIQQGFAQRVVSLPALAEALISKCRADFAPEPGPVSSHDSIMEESVSRRRSS
jgi:two-component system, chemotaxis family, protein-glutamate methylesterase/glutaminase